MTLTLNLPTPWHQTTPNLTLPDSDICDGFPPSLISEFHSCSNMIQRIDKALDLTVHQLQTESDKVYADIDEESVPSLCLSLIPSLFCLLQ